MLLVNYKINSVLEKKCYVIFLLSYFSNFNFGEWRLYSFTMFIISLYIHILSYIVNIFTMFIFIISLTNNHKLSDLKTHKFIILFCRSQGQHSFHWAKIKMWATSRGKFISCFLQLLKLPVFFGLCFFLQLWN